MFCMFTSLYTSMKKFNIWVEQRETEAIKDAIVSKIRSDLGGGDDDDGVMQMKTSELSPEMVRELLKLGPVMDRVDNSQSDQWLDFAQQDDTTVGMLINKIAGGGAEPQPDQETLPPEANPATTPQQSQNFPTGTGWS